MSKIKLLFIINPISGGKTKEKVTAAIEKYLDCEKFSPNYAHSSYAGHARLLAAEALQTDVQVIVAVGGDGTINEIAGEILTSDKIMGIVPVGSGNGLARFLKIPLAVKNAVLNLNELNVKTIDAASLNNRFFVNMAGLGFDAHISHVFSFTKGRGLMNYIKLGIHEFFGYKPKNYVLKIDGKERTERAFAISIANSSQYGNNVHIAPDASITDGLLEVCIIKPIPFFKTPLFIVSLLLKRAEKSNYVKIIRGKKIQLFQNEPAYIHIDGEPVWAEKEIIIQVKPLSLNVIVPNEK